jgi:hypothetical protein
MGIDDGMSAHHFLRREDFLAGVEMEIKNAKIKESESVSDQPGEMAATITVTEMECEFRRRAGIKNLPLRWDRTYARLSEQMIAERRSAGAGTGHW